MMGAKNKKSVLVEYAIDHGDVSPMFPLPTDRDAVGMHKKLYPDGAAASKVQKEGGDVLRKARVSVAPVPPEAQ